MKIAERFVYWVINSLIIFVVGFGTANLGHKVATSAAEERAAILVPMNDSRALGMLIHSAYAAEDAGPSNRGKLTP